MERLILKKNKTVMFLAVILWGVISLGFAMQDCAYAGEKPVPLKKFEFPEDNFSISMPEKPGRTDLLPRSKFYGKEDLTGAKQVQYVARYENSSSYSISYSVAASMAPDSLKKTMTLGGSSEDARRALISTAMGNIVREREIKYDGKYPGYEIEFEVPLNSAKFRGFKGITRMYIVGPMAFRLKIGCMPELNSSPKGS